MSLECVEEIAKTNAYGRGCIEKFSSSQPSRPAASSAQSYLSVYSEWLSGRPSSTGLIECMESFLFVFFGGITKKGSWGCF